jgi:hypothetical protein
MKMEAEFRAMESQVQERLKLQKIKEWSTNLHPISFSMLTGC